MPLNVSWYQWFWISLFNSWFLRCWPSWRGESAVGMAALRGSRGIGGRTTMIGGMLLGKQTGSTSGEAITTRVGLSSIGKKNAPGPESCNDPGAPTCRLGIMDPLERKARAKAEKRETKAKEKRELRVLPRRVQRLRRTILKLRRSIVSSPGSWRTTQMDLIMPFGRT